MVAVRFDDLSLAFDFVSGGAPMEHNAYLSIDTGRIYWISELVPVEEEIPDDLETSDRYLAIPHKNDLDLGRKLALRFVEQELPEHYDRAEDFFRSRGAYARFKQLLESEGVLEKWYKFEAESVEKALRDWCAENDIQCIEKVRLKEFLRVLRVLRAKRFLTEAVTPARAGHLSGNGNRCYGSHGAHGGHGEERNI